MNGERNHRLILLGLLLLALFAYLPAFHNDFTNTDDPAYVHDNPLIRSLAPSAIAAMFTHFHEGYHPLTLLTFALDYAVGGLNPFTYHFTNIMLHLLNAALLYVLALRLFDRRDVALITAGLFALNAVHVESVAWIPERKNVLYTCFYLMALLAYVRYLRQDFTSDTTGASPPLRPDFSKQETRWAGGSVRRPLRCQSPPRGVVGPPVRQTPLFQVSRAVAVAGGEARATRAHSGLGAYLGCFALNLLAILANGKALALAPTLLAIDLLLGRRLLGRRVIVEKIPFFLLSAAFGVVNVMSQQSAGYVYSPIALRWFEHLLVACHSLLAYAGLVLAPVNLVHQYPYPAKVGGHLPMAYLFAPLALLVALCGTAYSLRSSRGWAFGVLFYLFNIALVLKLLPFGGVMMEDHLVYVPSVGIIMIVAMAYVQAQSRAPRLAPILRAGLCIYLGALAGLTHARCQVWRNGITLWSDVLERYPESPRGWLNRGAARASAGDSAGALRDYRRALELTPRNGYIHYNIGNILLGSGAAAAACGAYDAALQLCPDLAAAHFYRAAAREQTGALAGALADYDRAIRMGFFSHRTYPHFRRGALLARIGRYTEARVDFDMTLRQVESSDAYYYRSFAAAQTGDRSSAIDDLAKALRLSADCPPELRGFFESNRLFAAAQDKTSSGGSARGVALP